MNRAVIETALFFHRRGWVPVRVERRGKMPIGGDGWQKLRPTPGEIVRWGDCNVGVLMGAASGGLTDIDLDCAEAIALAPFYLLETWTYGRAGKPRSHYWYICHGSHYKKFYGIDGKTLLEIRSDKGDGTPGHQSVAPSSINPSGELIEWDPDSAHGTDGPREIALDDLHSRVAKLVRGVIFMQAGATIDEARAKVAAYVPPPREQPKRTANRSQLTGDAVERARKYLARMDASISGSFGHTALFKAAAVLVRGFELDDATALDILRSDFNPRCQPEWDEADLERKVTQARDNATEYAFGCLLGERRRA